MIEKILALFGAHAAFEGLQTAIKKTAGDAVGTIVKKVTDEHRAELLAYIHNGGYTNIWRRYEATLPIKGGAPGDENRFVNLLSKSIMALKDTPDELKNLFNGLEKMTDDEFKEALYFLENDTVTQIAKKIWNKIDDGLKQLAPAINEFAENLKKGGGL